MKRFTLLLLIFDILIAFTFSSTNLNSAEIEHEKEAKFLYDMNLFNGISATSFVPDLATVSTREQAMKIIATSLQWDIDVNSRSIFKDVSDWAQPYVAKAYQLGITLGVSSTEFGGRQKITRQELATWMLRALGYDSKESWENTQALASNIGTDITVANSNTIINRDQLVGMLFSFLKVGKPLTKNNTLIQAYIFSHPEYIQIAVSSGMVNDSTMTPSVNGEKMEFALIESANYIWDSAKMIMKTTYSYKRALITSLGELMEIRDMGHPISNGSYITEYSYGDSREYYIKDIIIKVPFNNNRATGLSKNIYNEGNDITYKVVHNNVFIAVTGEVKDDRGMKLYYIDTATLISDENETNDDTTNVDTTKPQMKIGLATEIGGITDNSFGQLTWQGLQDFAAINGLDSSALSYSVVGSNGDYETLLKNLVAKNNDLIIATGFMFTETLQSIATLYPNQKFLLIDGTVELPNVASALFNEQEGSFLVGLAAGLKADSINSTQVGFIGGMDFELLQRFEAGFEAGVHAINPAISVTIDYVNSFVDADAVALSAAQMYNSGVTIIYTAAGSAGEGAIREAKTRVANDENAWVIGVDQDQYAKGIYDDGKSVVLTSMMKRVDTAAQYVCTMVKKGAFEGQIYRYGLKEYGVTLPLSNPNLASDWLSQIESYRTRVISGEIVVPTIPIRLK